MLQLAVSNSGSGCIGFLFNKYQNVMFLTNQSTTSLWAWSVHLYIMGY